jgi:hypothetical protein
MRCVVSEIALAAHHFIETTSPVSGPNQELKLLVGTGDLQCLLRAADKILEARVAAR